MTIGFATICTDGILLCSDTQITREGFDKYYEHKIFTHENGDWSVALAYAGHPSFAKSFYNAFLDAVDAIVDSPITTILLEQTLKNTLSAMDWSTGEQFLLLCGIEALGEMRLVKADNAKVYRTSSDFIGIGDTSVLRYLCSIFSTPAPSRQQVELFGTYILLQAKRWIDGCGGDTDIVLLGFDGHIEPSSRIIPVVEARFGILEKYFSRVAIGFLDEDISDSDFDKRLKDFSEQMKLERTRLMVPKAKSG